MARRLGGALVGIAALGCALLVASQHPLWPGAVAVAVLLWAVATASVPGLWLMAVPALLPCLDFAPWTGWLVVDEFDLLLLATMAGGWLRWATQTTGALHPGPGAAQTALLLCGVSSVVGLVRGWVDAGVAPLDLYQGYVDPLNSLRIAKSLLFALFLAPLLRRELAASAPLALRRFCIGMWAGMTVVAGAVAWERFAYPGLYDFSTPYRTTALFWEMHVGGAALDVYVAIASPFAAWAVWSARSARAWAASAALTIAWAYVVLTTFSRGVYGAVAVSLVWLAWRFWSDRRPRLRPRRWRRLGDVLLVGAVLLEVMLVIGTGSFLGSRLSASDRDLSSRMSHWRHGVQLLRTPLDVLIGLGSGRLPAHYAAEVPRREFSGAARAFPGAPGEKPGYLLLSGPRTVRSLGGSFGVTQRVPLIARARYSVELAVRARTDSQLRLLVCEMHLLYARHCQSAELRLPAAPSGSWVSLALPLSGSSLSPGPAFAPRRGVMMLSVLNAGGVVELSDLQLSAPGRPGLLRNGRFAEGMAHWFPVAQRYFLPWHIDNFVLETLIERGALGVLLLAGGVALALRASLRDRGATTPIAPFIAAAIVGVLLVGLVSSVMDMPRVAFLFFFLLLFAGHPRVEESSTTAA